MFSEYLKSTKERYLTDVRDGKGGDWLVVMGNEAGDLDSVASSIAYAWFSGSHTNPSHDKSKAIALIQTPHKDLQLRPENIHAFDRAGLPSSTLANALLCIDDVLKPDSQPAQSFPSHTFALVDHNRLLSPFASPSARVVAVLDHHADESLYLNTANPRIVLPTGSAASVVVKHIKERVLQPKEEKGAEVSIPREIATLLLCAILVDTGGLKPGGKAIDVDLEAAQFLFPLSTLSDGASSVGINTALTPESQPNVLVPGSALDTTLLHKHNVIDSLSQELFAKKSDVGHLSTVDLLRRDYKQYAWTSVGNSKPVNVGLSTVPIGLKSWLSPARLEHNEGITINPPKDVTAESDKKGKKKVKKEAKRRAEEEFWRGVEGWVEERGLDVLGILTTFRDAGKEKKKKVSGLSKLKNRILGKEGENDQGGGDGESTSDSGSSSSSSSSSASSSSDVDAERERKKSSKTKHKRQIFLVVRDTPAVSSPPPPGDVSPSADELVKHLRKGLEKNIELDLKRVKMKKLFKLRGNGDTGEGETEQVKDEETKKRNAPKEGGAVPTPPTPVVSSPPPPTNTLPKSPLRVYIYKQGNAKATRKVVAPLMQQIVERIGKSTKGKEYKGEDKETKVEDDTSKL